MKIKKQTVDYYHFYCPGCNALHSYAVSDDGSQWQFNGNLDSPTFTPSLLNTKPVKDEKGNVIFKTSCHLFVTNGKIIYCGDCTHALSGQTVEMPTI
jgi:hypothetical protein